MGGSPTLIKSPGYAMIPMTVFGAKCNLYPTRKLIKRFCDAILLVTDALSSKIPWKYFERWREFLCRFYSWFLLQLIDHLIVKNDSKTFDANLKILHFEIYKSFWKIWNVCLLLLHCAHENSNSINNLIRSFNSYHCQSQI